MSSYSGIDGRVYFDEDVVTPTFSGSGAYWLGANTFSLSPTMEAPDVTDFFSEGYRKRLAGLRDFKCTIGASWKSEFEAIHGQGGDPPLVMPGTSLAIRLALNTTAGEATLFDFIGIVSSWNATQVIEDASRYSIELLGCSVITRSVTGTV